jgi:succinate dehydrogenase / fumarate reductase membrane anchor subunit
MAKLRETQLWTVHVGAGLLILVLLGLHMTVMHLDATVGVANPAGGHPIDWANVAARAKSALFMASYVLLLWTALFHGLYGLRVILLELHPPAAVAKTVSPVLTLLGLALVVLGTWAAWASWAQPAAVQGVTP